MSNILRRIGVDVPDPIRRFLEGDSDSWLRVEEYQENNTLVVRTEVPGINPENDVDITLIGNQLQISVRRTEKSEHRRKHGYRSEFRYGAFSRSVTVPPGVTQEEIQASYQDGVLEVRVPLPHEPGVGPRKIPITRG